MSFQPQGNGTIARATDEQMRRQVEAGKEPVQCNIPEEDGVVPDQKFSVIEMVMMFGIVFGASLTAQLVYWAIHWLVTF